MVNREPNWDKLDAGIIMGMVRREEVDEETGEEVINQLADDAKE